MSTDNHEGFSLALSRFRKEVLRWNANFSLISRVDTRACLSGLIDESLVSFGVMRDRVLGGARLAPHLGTNKLHYIDLGSGAGFPGIVWHLMGQELGIPDFEHAGTLLVEPRAKRAWFLEHTASVLELEGLEVGEDQWGRRTGLSAVLAPERVVGFITLKALNLTDKEILAGWRRYRGNADDILVICRFHAPETPLDRTLRKNLLLPKEYDPQADVGDPWVEIVPFDVGSRPHALLVSVYPHI